jgi:7-alpha-hydroxysteroid dehydrogenase
MTQMGQLEGKVAVITGAGRGIGKAIALRYAHEGANVVVSSRTSAELEQTLAEAHLSDVRGLAVVADAMDREESRLPVSRALECFGHVDVLVNNVGGSIGNSDPFDGNDDAFEKTLVLCLTSAWWTIRAALPAMRERGFGRIINIGSGASKNTGGSVPYVAAKHGLVGLTKQLALPTVSKPSQVPASISDGGWVPGPIVAEPRDQTAGIGGR